MQIIFYDRTRILRLATNVHRFIIIKYRNARLVYEMDLPLNSTAIAIAIVPSGTSLNMLRRQTAAGQAGQPQTTILVFSGRD